MLTLMGPSDLWTVERAARHWGVSASRARAILSSRHIHRVSGYPAQAIKAVTLRQGARTDLKTANHLVPAAQAFTMAETGAAIGETEDERHDCAFSSSSSAAPMRPGHPRSISSLTSPR